MYPWYFVKSDYRARFGHDGRRGRDNAHERFDLVHMNDLIWLL